MGKFIPEGHLGELSHPHPDPAVCYRRHTKEDVLITVIEKTILDPPFNSDRITFKGASVSARPDRPRLCAFQFLWGIKEKKKKNPAETFHHIFVFA